MTEIAILSFDEGDSLAEVRFRRVIPNSPWEMVTPTTLEDTITFQETEEQLVSEWQEGHRSRLRATLTDSFATALLLANPGMWLGMFPLGWPESRPGAPIDLQFELEPL